MLSAIDAIGVIEVLANARQRLGRIGASVDEEADVAELGLRHAVEDRVVVRVDRQAALGGALGVLHGGARIATIRGFILGERGVDVGLVGPRVDVGRVDDGGASEAVERGAPLGRGIFAGRVSHRAEPAMGYPGVVVGPRIVGADGQRFGELVERPVQPRLRLAAVVQLVLTPAMVGVSERVPGGGIARVERDCAFGGGCNTFEQRSLIARCHASPACDTSG